jgi:hypothetical protein
VFAVLPPRGQAGGHGHPVYDTLELSDERVARIPQVMRARIVSLTQLSRDEICRSPRTLARLLDEERKLLRKHYDYDDRISEELSDEEQTRIRRERVAGEETIEHLSADYASTRATLDVALQLAGDGQAGYSQAGPTVRRLLNQAFFEQLRVREDDLAEPVLAEPFCQLLSEDLVDQVEVAESERAEAFRSGTGNGVRDHQTPDLVLVGGSISDPMVELGGLEPPTSWVRSRRTFALSLACLQGFAAVETRPEAHVFRQFPPISAGIGPKNRVLARSRQARF